MRRPLDIAVIGDARSTHNQIQLGWLAERGHRVRLLTDSPAEVPGVEVLPITWEKGTRTLLRHLNALRNTRRVLEADRPDLLHIHMPVPYGYWNFGLGIRPVAVTVWGNDVLVDPYRHWLIKQLVVRSLEEADLLITDAEELAAAIRRLTTRTAPIHVLQWGVDFDKDLAHLPPLEGRREFVLNGPPTLLGFRRLMPRLRPLDILEAFALVKREVPEARLMLAGTGEQEEECRRRACDLGLEPNVEFLGWISLPELLSHMAACQVALTVPESDGTPHSLLLAMAVPCAVVASDIQANREWLEPGRGAHFVPIGDVDAMARACLQLLRDRQQAWEFAEHNRGVVREHGDRQKHFEALEDLYYRAVRGS